MTQTPAQRRLILAYRAELQRMEPSMRRAYARAWHWLTEQMTTEVMVARLDAGMPLTDLIPQSILDRAFAPVQAQLREAQRAGVQIGARQLPTRGLDLGISFNTLSPRVLEGIRTLDARILSGAKAEVRETLRQFVEAGITEGKGSRAIARTMREVVGLAPSHEEHIRNYRRKLEKVGQRKLGGARSPSALENVLRDKRTDAKVRRAARDGIPLTPEYITKQVQHYTRKYIAWHAETVARTATLDAFRTGQASAMESAMERGYITPSETQKIWTTVGDSRVRPEHVGMNGERVPYTQPFSNGLMVPNEWNCRCLVTYDIRPAGSRTREQAVAIMRERGSLAPV